MKLQPKSSKLCFEKNLVLGFLGQNKTQNGLKMRFYGEWKHMFLILWMKLQQRKGLKLL